MVLNLNREGDREKSLVSLSTTKLQKEVKVQDFFEGKWDNGRLYMVGLHVRIKN